MIVSRVRYLAKISFGAIFELGAQVLRGISLDAKFEREAESLCVSAVAARLLGEERGGEP